MSADHGQELRKQLAYLKDAALGAAHSGQTARYKEGLELYVEMVRAFVDRLVELGSVYDRERAIRELTSLGDEWSEIRWIEDELYELIEAAFTSENLNLIREAIWLPVRLGRLGFDARDYYTFHRFIQALRWCYQLAADIGAPQVREQSIDLCSRYVVEQSNFVIGPALERCTTSEEIAETGDFALGATLIFGGLLKAAFERRDARAFGQFSKALGGLFDLYRRDALNQTAGGSGEAKEAHDSLRSQLNETRHFIFFGLGAWILRRYLEDDLHETLWRQFDEELEKPASVDAAWETLLKAREHETQEQFGWHRWELEGTEGQAIYIQIGHDLERYFLFLALAEAARRQLPYQLRPSPEIDSLAGRTDAPFDQMLSAIEQNPEAWERLLGSQAKEPVEAVRTMIQATLGIYQEQEAQAIILAPLSRQRIEHVKQNIIKEWRNNALMRALISRFGIYDQAQEAPPEQVGYFGINTRDLKELYIEQERLAWHHWGEDYGRAIANGEDERVLETIMAVTRRVPALDRNSDGLPVILRRALDQMGPASVVLVSSWRAHAELQMADSFTQDQGDLEGLPDVLGRYQGFPVFRMHLRKTDGLVVVLDLKRLGVWRQYPAMFPEAEALDEVFGFAVTLIDEERARDMVKSRPELSEGKTREEAIRELQRQVHLRVLERFEYQALDASAALAIEQEE